MEQKIGETRYPGAKKVLEDFLHATPTDRIFLCFDPEHQEPAYHIYQKIQHLLPNWVEAAYDGDALPEKVQKLLQDGEHNVGILLFRHLRCDEPLVEHAIDLGKRIYTFYGNPLENKKWLENPNL